MEEVFVMFVVYKLATMVLLHLHSMDFKSYKLGCHSQEVLEVKNLSLNQGMDFEDNCVR
jgi:hypothetical protein